MVDKCYSGKEIQVVTYKDCSEVNEIQEFLEQSVKDCCEGLMVKPLDQNSTYEPAKRSFKWLKVKKDYIEGDGIGDSLDLVVIGAKYGSGKRTGKFGAYLVACYDPDYDTFEGCCIVGTGYSD
jgi:DNA ligase-1